MKHWLQALWWRRERPPLWLRVLEPLYGAVADARAERHRQAAEQLPVPVIVVGNIAVGGTGKTPVTLALVEMLQALGATPAVISRGYGGAGPFPLLVQADTPAQAAGDEPVLMAQRAAVPVCVAPSRLAAGRALLAAHPGVDVLLCDDGLQHYALARDRELCVIDGARGHGNAHRLPAGPLREPAMRLAQCDLVLVNGADPEPYGDKAFRFDLIADAAIELRSGERRALSAFAGQVVEAMAGIGNPQRFFDLLMGQGIAARQHPRDDHYVYAATDFAFTDGSTVLMTEKDAVKCRALALPRHLSIWFVPVRAQFSQAAHLAVQECLHPLLQPCRATP